MVGRGSGQGAPSVPERGLGSCSRQGDWHREEQGSGTAEGSRGQEKIPKPVLPLVPGPQICPGAGIFLPDPPACFWAWACPWGAWQRIWDRAALGEWRSRLPPRALAGCWADRGRQTGAEYLLLPFPAGQRQLLPVSGAPTPPLSVEPLPSLGPVRGREVCKLGSGQAALVRTPTPPPPPQTPHL